MNNPPSNRAPDFDTFIAELRRAYEGPGSMLTRYQRAVGLVFDAFYPEARLDGDALESRPPAAAVRPCPWDDLKATVQFLLKPSLGSANDPFIAYARERERRLRAATQALEAEWEESKHPRDVIGRWRDADGGGATTSGSPGGRIVSPGDVETAGEHAGADGAVSGSFNARVQAALQALDPQVAAWWAANSVRGVITTRNASGWLTFLRSNEANAVTSTGRPQVIVDNKYTSGQTAQAIISAARENMWPTGIGLPFYMYRSSRGDSAAEFVEWRKKAYAEAAQDASVLAEIYAGTIAGITPAGDLVVAANDIAENGLTWNSVLQALPLIGKALPLVTGAIILKIGKAASGTAQEIRIAQKTLQQLKSLPLAKQRAITKAALELGDAKKAAAYIANEADAAVAARAASGATKYAAKLGKAVRKDYAKTFFEAYPKLEGRVVVHHAIPQDVLNKYPGIISEAELHSLENLRGIPKDDNSKLHLSRIAKQWNAFFDTHPTATKAQLLKKATEIDLVYGKQFTPRVGQ